MENKVRDNMMELFKQFCKAYDIEKPNIDDQGLVDAFFEWMNTEKKDNDEFYLNMLNSLGVKYKSSRTIEVGKNSCDSLVLPFRTIIAPKSGEGFEELDDKRVIVSNLKIHGKLPFLIQKGVHVDHSIPCDVYDTFMTQNPYSYSEIAEWNKLPMAYHNIVVGAYGDMGDTDRIEKIQMMRQFMESLDPRLQPIINELEINDKYAAIVTANKKK